jgi:hypothetical protein
MLKCCPFLPALLLTWAPSSRAHFLQGWPDPSAACCGQCPARRARASSTLPRSKDRLHLGGRKAPPPAPPLLPPLGAERHRALNPRTGCGQAHPQIQRADPQIQGGQPSSLQRRSPAPNPSSHRPRGSGPTLPPLSDPGVQAPALLPQTQETRPQPSSLRPRGPDPL